MSVVERSKRMALIRSKNTKPELILKKALRGKGFLYQPKMLGHPDFANKKKKIAIFVDGELWHGYNWKILKSKLKNKYWIDKITANMARDKKNNRKLRKMGWVILRIWSKEIDKNKFKVIEKIENGLNKPKLYKAYMPRSSRN